MITEKKVNVKHTMKSLNYVLISLFFMSFLILHMNHTTVSAAETDTKKTQSYSETALKFQHKDECENGPWDLERKSDGSIYAYEWDTFCKESGMNSIYYCTLNKMIWSTKGKLTYQSIKMNSKFSKRISSGDDVNVTKQDKKGNLYVIYHGKYNGKDQETMLTVLNKKGTIVKDIMIENVLKHYNESSSFHIRDMHVDGDIITLLVYEDYSSPISIQQINWKTKKRLSSQKLDDMINLKIIGSYVYGVKYQKNNEDSAETSTGEDQLMKYSLDGSELLWNHTLPEGALALKDENDVEDFNKFDYDTVKDTIYVCNAEGIYYADTTDENSEFSLLIPANESTYIDKYYTIVELRVINNERFYILSIAGFDDESPSDLAMYTRKKYF